MKIEEIQRKMFSHFHFRKHKADQTDLLIPVQTIFDKATNILFLRTIFDRMIFEVQVKCIKILPDLNIWLIKLLPSLRKMSLKLRMSYTFHRNRTESLYVK